MYTRKQYLNRECSHDEYYSQFVTPGIINTVRRLIGEQAIKASTDPAFNDIPLAKWDNCFLPSAALGKTMRELGDYPTLAGAVCIAKAAAQQIKNSA